MVFLTNVKATDECFEGLSRSVFKFNMVLDDIVLEPIAKGYNKLPNPIKTGTSNFTSNMHFFRYQIHLYKNLTLNL